MIHLGIDHHKKYSHVIAINDSGEVVWDGRLESDLEAFRVLKASLPEGEPIQSVLEAGRNWGILYDALDSLGFNPKLANPLKMRLIAETFTKTDKIDASTHAIILKAGLTPLVHVPPKARRDQKNLLRQRTWLVKLQTMLKNRIHNVIDRNHHKPPEQSDLFGSYGRKWLEAITLPAPDDKILRADLELLDGLRAHIRQTQKWLDETLSADASMSVLMSLPGVGKLLAAIIALEIDDIERFPSASKLCAYSGLANSTHSSGGKTFHGGMIPRCNHHLKYAFIEAAWTAIRVSPYYGAYFNRLKHRKGVHDAIGAVARKMCEVAYYCLKQRRAYEERPYEFRPGRLAHRLA